MSGLLTCSAECTVETPIAISDMLEMGDMHDENAKIESLFTTLETGEKAVASLESLVAYKEDLITSDITVSKQTVEALNITLESICLILDYPVDHVTVSTESITEDDTSLTLSTGLEKEKSLLAKAWEAIMKVIADIMQFVSDMITTLMRNVKNLPKAMAAVQANAKDVERTLGDKAYADTTFKDDQAGNIADKFAVMIAINDNKLDSTILNNSLTEYMSLMNMVEATSSIKTTTDYYDKIYDMVSGSDADYDLDYTAISDMLQKARHLLPIKQDTVLVDLSKANVDNSISIVGTISYYGDKIRAVNVKRTTLHIPMKYLADETQDIYNIKIITVNIKPNNAHVKLEPISLDYIIKDDVVPKVISKVNANMKPVKAMLKHNRKLVNKIDRIVGRMDMVGGVDVRKYKIFKVYQARFRDTITFYNKFINYTVSDSYKQTIASLYYYTRSIEAIKTNNS